MEAPAVVIRVELGIVLAVIGRKANGLLSLDFNAIAGCTPTGETCGRCAVVPTSPGSIARCARHRGEAVAVVQTCRGRTNLKTSVNNSCLCERGNHPHRRDKSRDLIYFM